MTAEKFDFETIGSKMWSEVPIVVFDLETTGFGKHDKIVEFGGVIMEGTKVVKDIHHLVNPGMLIPKEATAVHGITDDHVKTAPRWRAVAKECFDFLFCGYPIVSHNFSFDARKLSDQVDPTHWPRNIFTLCTMVQARENGHKGKAKLTDLAEHYNLEYESEHTALADAVVTGMLARRFAGAQFISKFYTKTTGEWADQFKK